MATLKPFSGELDKIEASSQKLKPFNGTLDGESPSLARQAGDLGISLLKGAIAVPEAAVGLADIPTGGRVGKFLENEGGAIGFRPKQAKEILSNWQSDDLKAKQQQFQNAEGVVDKVGVALSNPSLIANAAVESLAPMGTGGVLGRGLMAVAPKLGAVGAGAIGEGVVGAGSASEQTRQETNDGLLTAQQSALAGASGLATAGFGALGGKVAQKLGIGDVDTMLTQGTINTAGNQTTKGLLRRGAEGALSEGILEELPQSLSEQAIQNAALNKPLTEGLADAGVMGALTGGVMGGGAGVVSGFGAKPESQPEQDPAADQPATPALGFNPNAGAATVFPDGSVIMDSETPAGEKAVFDKRYAPQPVKPSEAMGLDPAAGPMSAAATMAVDGGAAAQVQQEQALQQAAAEGPKSVNVGNASERDQQLYQQEIDYQRSKQGVGDRRKATIEGMLERAAMQGDGARAAPAPDDTSIPFGVANGQPDATRIAPRNTGAATRMAEPGGTQADVGRVFGVDTAAGTGQPERFPALTGQQPTTKATAGQKVKSLKELIARKKAEREALNVQNTPQGAAGTQATQAQADQAPQAMGSQSAGPAAGVPREGSAGVEAAGVSADAVGDERQFTPETGTLGIPRADMPQVPTSSHGGLVKHLNAKGIAHETTTVDAGQLKPTQAEFSPSKVEKARNAEGDRAVIVSSDGHIIDGHHQALAAAQDGKPVKAIVLDAPVDQALQAVKDSPSAQPRQPNQVADQPQKNDQPTPGAQVEPTPTQAVETTEKGPQQAPGTERQVGAQRYTHADAQGAEKQVAQSISDRIDSMTSEAVHKIAKRFLPTMGVKSPVGKPNIKKAVTDFAKVNPLAAAAEFGVELPDAVKRPLEMKMEGRLEEDGAQADSATTAQSQPKTEIQPEPSNDAGSVSQAEAAEAVKPEKESTVAKKGPQDEPQKPANLKQGIAKARAKKAAEAEAQRADYFTPGNIVKGYGGHDRVVEYTPVDERGTWSVRVQRVVKQGDAWVDAPNERPRSHMTLPSAKELAAGPVVKAPAITRDQEQALYGYLREQSANSLRYEMLAKKFQRTADGTANDADRKITLEWLKAMTEDSAAKQHAAVKSEQDAVDQAAEAVKIEAEKQAISLAELKQGKAGNPRYQAFLDTLEQDQLDAATRSSDLNTRFMAFIAKMTADFKQSGGQSSDRDGFTKFIRSYADENLAARLQTAKATSQTPAVDRHIAVMESVRAGTSTSEQFKASFDEVVTSAEAIKAELATKTKVELLRFGGPFVQMRYANEKKAEVVDAVYLELLGEYALGSSVTYGMGKGSYEAAVRKMVEATDADKLAQYAKDRQAAIEEAKAKRAARAAGLANPQTLDDFRSLLNTKIQEGMTRKEAFLTLTPEQRIQYDELEAEGTRDTREAAKRAAKTAVRAAGQSTGGDIIATKHTRDGYDLFVVQLADRLSREDYQTVLASAKRMGGWYSAFRGNGAIPGFQFKDRAAADAFLKLAGGDTSAAREQAAQRRDAFEDDRSQTAVERLREMADRTEDAANEELGRDRKANTERRARFASAALNAAEASKAMAKTMRNIAQAIDDGKAKFLDAVRTRTQVETLMGYVRTAKDNELRAKHPSYAEQEKRKGEPATAETADFAEFPAFTAFRSDLASLGRQMLEIEGTKKLGQRLMSVADDVTDAYLEFAKKNLDRVSQFGRGDAMADFASRDMAEKALKRSGLTGKAIVLPVKRGQNRVILSPSEAINRSIWQGDGDKRITLTMDFGNELVEAIGRRGNKQNGLTVPWQFQTAYDRRKALSRMGIETPSEFRSALREFIGLQERATANRVRELELSMTGRKADGLDFFPTPAEIADQMVEAADIQPDMAVLEPSAGMAHIADRIRAAGAEPDVIELSGDRRELLQEKGYNLSDATDFLDLKPRTFFTYGDVFRAPDGAEGIMRGAGSMGSQRVRLVNEAGGMVGAGFYDRADLTGIGYRGAMSGYDRIIMNPPFSNRRDAEHVRHAYTLLKPGGRIVAIMGEGVFFGQDKKAQDFRDWLESVGGTSEKLPDGSFLDPSLPVNTGVNARMVVIDKPAGDVAFSRSPATQAAYDARIDALFDGGKATTGTKVLDSSDLMGLLGFPKVPLMLNESHLRDGLATHPEMTAQAWKKVPEWIENPAMAYRSLDAKNSGRIVVVGPELLAGYPVVMAIEPKPGVVGGKPGQESTEQLLVTVFAKTTGVVPAAIAARQGRLLYLNKENAQLIGRSGGVQFPKHDDISTGRNKILGEKHLNAYRRSSEPGFSRGTGKSGMPASTVQQLVNAIKSRWENAPDIVVVESMQDPLMPEAARAEDSRQKSLGASGEPEGFIYKGKVYVVAGEMHTPMDVIRVTFHESLGHYGLHKVFGKELGSILNQIATMRKADVKAKAEQYGLDLSDPKQRLMAAEEVLAEMAQTRPDMGFVKRAIAAIRTWLRTHVPGFKSLGLTDAEIINSFILPARAYVERGAQVRTEKVDGMVPAFSRSTLVGAASKAINNVREADSNFDVSGATGERLAHYRGMVMQALGRRQIVDLYGDMLPELREYDELVQRMDADKNESGAEADTLVRTWAGLDERAKMGLGAPKNPGMELKLAELMHDATLAGIDPAKPMEATASVADKMQHAAMKKRFDALSVNAQATYRQARDMYVTHFQKVRKAIAERIDRSGIDESTKKSMIARMDDELFKKMGGVYFPLARFGKYVVVSKDANGQVVSVSRAETLQEASSMRRVVVDNSASGVTVSRVFKDAEFSAQRDAVGKGFVSDLMTLLQKEGVDDGVLDAVGQLYLASMPDLSWAKHGLHRKGMPGFSQDARRAFAQNMFHGARYLAKLRYADQLSTKLQDMEKRVIKQREDEGFDPVKAQQVVDELNARHENLMNPKTHPLSSALTSAGFVWYLGVSPASAMVNLSQTALVAYPVLASKWGFKKASAALLKASKETVQAKNDLSKALKGDELAAFERAVKDGTIDVTQAHDLAGVAQGEDERVAWAMRPVMRAASFFFHHAEKFNRQATFMAAYRLAKETGADSNAAFAQAKKATYDGHFDYAASNRPRIMQGNWQKVLFLFKQYGQNMVYTLTRQAYLSMKGMTAEQRTEARKQLGGILALHAAAAGALGLPLVGTLLSAASFLGGDDDEPWDAEVALKNMLADTFGQKPAEVMAHGLSRLTPWDISGRVALNKLILPDIQEGLEGMPLWEKMVTAAVGPVPGIAGGFLKGVSEMGDGHFTRGLESMLPVVLKGPAKAYRYATEGDTDKTGIVIKDDVGISGVAGQFIGLRPSELALAREGRGAIYNADKALMDRRSNLTRMYAMARMEGDDEGVQDAVEEIRRFNEKNPTRRITMLHLMQGVKTRQKRIAQAEQGVYLPRNRRDVEDVGRFALTD